MSGSSDAAVSVAFACYSIGVLPSLFFFGAISNRIGRRLTLQTAVFFSFLSILTIVLFPGVPGLSVSRILQGVAIGLSGASATAFLAESLQGAEGTAKAAAYVTAMLPLGFGVGGLSTGLCLLASPTLLPWSYQAFFISALLILFGLQRFHNSSLSSQTSILRLPYFPRGGIPYSIAIGTQWCLVGVVLSTVPIQLGHHHVPSWGGLTAFFMPITGLICQQIAKKLPPRQATRIGLMFAPAGCLLLAIGIGTDSLWLVLTGAAVSGAAGLGFSFYGGLAGVALASRNDKARGAAGFFLACYTGLSFAPPILSFLSGESGIADGLAGMTVVLFLASLGIEMMFRSGGRQVEVIAAE
jgi:MFS family permease